MTALDFYYPAKVQPKGFYPWMDEVSRLAYQKDFGLTGDEQYFIGYYKKGYTPRQAIRHWENDPWPNMGGGE